MTGANEAQIEFWNSDEARHWVDHQDRYDRMLAPFTEAVLGLADLGRDERVLDVGCGTGATTCVAARRAPGGSALGVDVSEPMVAAARRRAAAEGLANVEFTVADAQTASLPSSADVLVSRFGVMFFDDPVAAFTNLRGALTPDGRLAFACWRPMIENEWMAVPLGAALAHLAPPAAPEPNAPGPFAFGDCDRVAQLLASAGFRDVAVEALDTPILVAGGGTVADAVTFIRSTGMGRVLFADSHDKSVREALDAIGTAFAHHAGPDGVRLGAAAWLVSARA
jgi:SAM-dependent methyltransferase